jgi:hypothetical protein
VVHLWRKLFACAVGAAVLIMAGLVAYHAISPKILISNHSKHATSEVKFNLPDNRVTFSPLQSGSSATIYFNKQRNNGFISYELQLNEHRVTGSRVYSVDNQLGRTIHLNIDSSGVVKLNVEG